MGIYDRQYYRDEYEPRGYSLGGQRMMVTNLVIFTAAIWAIDQLLPVSFNGLLGLHTDLLQRPWQLYQLLTYGFAHTPLDPGGIMHIGFNMFGLWMFGRDVELRYGWREFLRFYLVAIIFSGAVWLALQYAVGNQRGLLVGASGGVIAVVILFIMNFPKRTLYLFMVLPMPAWVAGLLFVGLDLLGAASGTGNVAYEAHLAGAAFAFGYYRLHWQLVRYLRLPGLPRFSLPSLKRKPQLRVHDPESYYQELDREADRVLDKLHRDGERSLTEHERQVLEDYSRRMRQKHS